MAPTASPRQVSASVAATQHFGLSVSTPSPANVRTLGTFTVTATALHAVALERYRYWVDFGDGQMTTRAPRCNLATSAHNSWSLPLSYAYNAIGTYHLRATVRDCAGHVLATASASVRVLGQPIYDANGPDVPNFSLSTAVADNTNTRRPFPWSVQLVQSHDGDGWFTNIHVDWGNGQVSNFAPHPSSVGGSSCEQSARLSGGYPHYHRDISNFPAPFDAEPGATYHLTVTATSDSCDGASPQTVTKQLQITFGY